MSLIFPKGVNSWANRAQSKLWLSMSPRTRRFIVTGFGLTAFYWIDSELYAKTFQRNIRTFWNGLWITYNYKFRFREGADIAEIHRDAAERILYTCQKNGGLYVKFGQSVASMNHILPPQYNNTLTPLFMEAPSVPFDQVVKLFKEEFNCHPDELFVDFERSPVASASIAQVHRAKLPDGTPVAVKVQKHYISKQIFWDMLGYKIILKAFEYAFELPLYWSADHVERHLRQELDFKKEAENSERAMKAIASDKLLSKYLYVPKVHWAFTTSRILTAEWIEGVPLTNVDALTNRGFPIPLIMERIVDVLSHQIFVAGFVHADPHPGNILVRWNPEHSSRVQVCLLDHGLYMEESDKFRKEYCQFWKGLFLREKQTLDNICESWGIRDTNIFASATLQRPYNPSATIHIEKPSLKDLYRMQMVSKERIKQFLGDTEKIPRELIFLGRTLNLIRANNKHLGSPVNRINIMVSWAVKGLGSDWAWKDPRSQTIAIRQHKSWSVQVYDHIRPSINMFIFRSQLFFLSIGFWFTRTWQVLKEFVTGNRQKGFEDVLDDRMIKVMRNKFGIQVNKEAFQETFSG